MRLASNISRFFVLVTIVAVVFSPFQPIFALHTAKAATDHVGDNSLTLRNETDSASCGLSGNDFAICITNVVYAFTVGIGTGIGWVASYFFSLAVGLSLHGPTYAAPFVATGWTIIRDIANMFFILILVYIAFQLMFKAETSGTMQTLVWVVMMALVINFSFFATRLVIDAGNILAVQFYNLLPAGTNLPGSEIRDLSQTIMQGIGVQEMLSTDAFQQYENTGDFLQIVIGLSFIYISVGIMLFMLAATLFMVGLKFLIRIVVLWLTIMAAPAALVALAFPNDKIKRWYGMWQDKLINHAFYPAVFLFVFYILDLFMLSGSSGQQGDCGNGQTILGAVFCDLANSDTQGFQALGQLIANVGLRLGFVIVILYLGLRVSETMGVMGSNAARSFARGATRTLSGAAYGGAGRLLRNTAGVAAGNAYKDLKKNPTLRNASINGNWLQKRAARTLYGGLDTLRTGSYDVRGMPGVQKVVRPALSTAQYGLGPKVGPISFDIGGPSEGKIDGRLERIARVLETKPPKQPSPAASAAALSEAVNQGISAANDNQPQIKAANDNNIIEVPIPEVVPERRRAAVNDNDLTANNDRTSGGGRVGMPDLVESVVQPTSPSSSEDQKAALKSAQHATELLAQIKQTLEEKQDTTIITDGKADKKKPAVDVTINVAPHSIEVDTGSTTKEVPIPANNNSNIPNSRADVRR